MTAMGAWWRGWALCAGLVVGACAEGPGAMSQLRLALAFEGHAAFRLRVYLGTPGSELSGDVRFDSGCLTRTSTTFEISELPVGSNYSLVYQAWAAPGCEGAPIATGFRGSVAVADAARDFLHLPVYAHGRGTALPLDLNLSALAATPVATCTPSAGSDVVEGCAGDLDRCVSFEDGAWCVPTCREDSDCTEGDRAVHPQATCEQSSGWCMLAAPYPLNTSEPRAFARAVTRPDGDVVFIGGLRATPAGLGPTRFALEAFDAQVGVFSELDVSGFEGRPAWGFGLLPWADGAVVVGGLRGLDGLDGASGRLAVTADRWAAGVSSAWVLDFAAGAAVELPLGRALSEPGVVALDATRFLVAGGIVATETDPGSPTSATALCTFDPASPAAAGCVEGPPLGASRVAPALRCVAGTTPCDAVLVIGGAAAAEPAAELLLLNPPDGAPRAEALRTEGVPAGILSAVVCDHSLVGGTTEAGPFQQGAFDVTRLNEGLLTMLGPDDLGQSAEAPYLAGHGADGCGPTFGGLAPDGNPSATVRVDGAPGGPLEVTRIGAAAGRIGAGPLRGAWVVLGGAAPAEDASGALRPLPGAEIWLP